MRRYSRASGARKALAVDVPRDAGLDAIWCVYLPGSAPFLRHWLYRRSSYALAAQVAQGELTVAEGPSASPQSRSGDRGDRGDKRAVERCAKTGLAEKGAEGFQMAIDKVQAAVLVENAHGLWIRAKTFELTHEHLRENKSWWFKQLARTTLAASIITVVLSAFGFSNAPEAPGDSASGTVSAAAPSDPQNDPPSDSPGDSPSESPSGGAVTPVLPDSSRVVWALTGLAALLAAMAKLLEQHIGRQDDIQAHLHAELTLDAKMDALKLLVARIMSYSDGTQPHDLHELAGQYDVLAIEVADTGKLVGASPDKSKESEAKMAIANTSIDISLARVQIPQELPDEAPGVQMLVRGG